MSNKLAVLGSPIAHSKSPLIHSAAYRVLDLDWQYERFEVIKGALKSFIDEVGTDYIGFSLTMPLKEQAFRIAESRDRSADATGAVNTLVRTATGWAGFNTDVFGIVESFRRGNVSTDQVLIVGSGATARSALVALSQVNPSARVVIFARNEAAKRETIEFAKSLNLKAKAAKNLLRKAKKVSLTISTLPANALDEYLTKAKKFEPNGDLFDVAYEPWPSLAANLWRRADRNVISGLEMLLWQAVAQIRLFTSGDSNQPLDNEAAVIEAMRHSLES